MSEVAMKGPLDIHQHLLAHDVHHEIVRLRRMPLSATTLAEALDLPPHRCVAVHPFHSMTPDGDVLALLLTPADIAVDESAVCHTIGQALRPRLGAPALFKPAGPALVSSHTDYLAGHLCPLLLPPDVIVFVTQSLADLATAIVYTATGDAGTALGIRALDLVVLAHAMVLPQARDASARRRPVTIDLNPARAALHLDEAGRSRRERRAAPRPAGTTRAAS